MNIDDNDSTDMLITLTSDIVAAHVSNNRVEVADVPRLITSIHEALSGLGSGVTAQAPPEPAVSIRSSVKKDHLVCLEDGKKMKMLKRHLMTEHGMSPDEYRQRWGLSSEYPMVAADYADTRRELAKKIGLGRKRSEAGTAQENLSEPGPGTARPCRTKRRRRVQWRKLGLGRATFVGPLDCGAHCPPDCLLSLVPKEYEFSP